MRIRSIRPEFYTSEDIARLDWHHRLVFIGLWSYVDDNGVGRDVERLIVADLFPLDKSLSEASVRVHGALKALEAGGQIERYTVDGKPYLHITAWDKHQKINRASEGRYPLPTSENAEGRKAFSEPSVSPQSETPLGEGEKGRRGEGETLSATEREQFEQWWTMWPKKTAKGDARKAFTKAVKTAGLTALCDGATRYAQWIERNRIDSRYIVGPGKWLRDERWEDELADRTPEAPQLDRRAQLMLADRQRYAQQNQARIGGEQWQIEQ